MQNKRFILALPVCPTVVGAANKYKLISPPTPEAWAGMERKCVRTHIHSLLFAGTMTQRGARSFAATNIR